MKYLFFVVRSAIFDFSRNKSRTILTSLGIVIGILSVVLINAFGEGLNQFIKEQFDSLGTNTLYVYPGKLIQDGKFNGDGGLTGSVRFDMRDVEKLQRLDYVEAITPLFQINGDVSSDKETKYAEVNSANADVFNIWNITAQYGSLFTVEQVQKRSKVAVIGPDLAKDLYELPEFAIGRNIKIKSQNFRIIGVAESKGGGGLGGPGFDSMVYIPLKTGYIFNPDKKFVNIMISAYSEDVVSKLKNNLTEALSKRYEEDDFSVIEQKEILETVTSIFGTMNIVLLAIAAVSLLVGGIGIMNIMYVTVSERTKEIGIRRALGARKFDILSQFVIESVILSLFGGIGALGLAYLIATLVTQYFPVIITAGSVALAVGVSSVIGVIFGVFPAKKAADLSPIEAIRYE